MDPIIGKWKSGALVSFPSEDDPDVIAVEFTVDTTLTVNKDGTFHLINLLDGYDPDGPFTDSEEYTGTWQQESNGSYAMKAEDLDTWGEGVGTYQSEDDSFSTVWVEPRGEFNTEFKRK